MGSCCTVERTNPASKLRLCSRAMNKPIHILIMAEKPKYPRKKKIQYILMTISGTVCEFHAARESPHCPTLWLHHAQGQRGKEHGHELNMHQLAEGNARCASAEIHLPVMTGTWADSSRLRFPLIFIMIRHPGYRSCANIVRM